MICMKFGIDILYLMPLIIVSFVKIGAVKAIFEICAVLGILRSVEWLFSTDVSGLCMGAIFKGHAVQETSTSWTAWPLKMVPIGCPETSVLNNHSTLRALPEERRTHLLCEGSLQLRKAVLYICAQMGTCQCLLHLLSDSYRIRYRNEYQWYFLAGKGSRCVRLTTLPPLCSDFL